MLVAEEGKAWDPTTVYYGGTQSNSSKKVTEPNVPKQFVYAR